MQCLEVKTELKEYWGSHLEIKIRGQAVPTSFGSHAKCQPNTINDWFVLCVVCISVPETTIASRLQSRSIITQSLCNVMIA